MIPVMKPWLDEEEVAAAADAIRSGWVAQGPRVALFEDELAAFVGNREGIAVSSCTTGLHLVLHALGIGPGDEVIVPSLSFIATANAPRYVGASPVFADVHPVTQNLTVESIGRAMTERTRAVILVHQVGMPADLDPIRDECEASGIAVIEDAACAIGSTYKGRQVGAAPGIAVFSFHPRKLLTTGEGGMIVTDDEELARRLRTLRQHAMSVSAADRHAAERVVVESYPELGFNFRLTDIQAAVGLVQLRKLPEMVARRRHLAGVYAGMLEDVPGVVVPRDPPFGTTNYQSYSVFLDAAIDADRDVVMQRMLDRGISTRRGVMAAHLERAFSSTPRPPLPVTELLTNRSLILPLYHEMGESEAKAVVEALCVSLP